MREYPDANFLSFLAHDAGAIILEHFNLERNWTLKDDSTPLTEADLKINELVLNRMRGSYPHINFLGEEGNREVADAEYTALCDPIDGTADFAAGIPVSAFCLTIVKVDEPVASVIYDPFLKRMWMARRGEGAFLNGKPVHVSAHREVKDSNVMLVKWHNCGFDLVWVEGKLMEQGAKVQNITSLAYFGGLIASGTVEASIFPGRGVLETAAMQVIVEEAGGQVTDLEGDRIRYQSSGYKLRAGALVSNGVLHEKLLRLANPTFIPE